MSKNKASKRTSGSSKNGLKPQAPATWKMMLFFTVVALILYGNTLGHEYALDDDVVFLKNQFVQSGFNGFNDILSNGFITGFNGTNDQSYRPLVLMTFATEHAIFGNSPFIGHLINVMLYAFCGYLVWRLMQQFFRESSAWVPLLISLVFLAHPVHTEAVANIKGRDDILHFLFVTGALLYLMRYSASQHKKELIISGLLYFAALLCKEMAVTFVAIIPLTLWFFTDWKIKRIVLQSSFYIGILVAYLLIRLSVLSGLTFDEDMQIINNGLAAASTETERLATALMIMGLYVKLLFAPFPLSWDYSFNEIPIVGPGSWQTIVAIILFLGLGFFAVRGLTKKDPIAWGILFFLISMSIVSNVFIMLGATMGERFLFTPSLGFAMIVVILILRLGKIKTDHGMLLKQKALTIPLTIILLVFSIKTITRNEVWKNNDSLYASGVKTAPNSTRTWAALGTSYRIQGEKSQYPSERQSLFTEALNCYQRSVDILEDNFESWYNMGVVYNQLGDGDRALLAFQKTVSISPSYANGWNNIGAYYSGKKQYDLASESFQKAYDLNPNDGNVVANMGMIYHNRGDLSTAISFYLKGLQLQPNNLNTAKNLALAYRQNGQPDKAVPYENLSRQAR